MHLLSSTQSDVSFFSTYELLFFFISNDQCVFVDCLHLILSLILPSMSFLIFCVCMRLLYLFFRLVFSLRLLFLFYRHTNLFIIIVILIIIMSIFSSPRKTVTRVPTHCKYWQRVIPKSSFSFFRFPDRRQAHVTTTILTVNFQS